MRKKMIIILSIIFVLCLAVGGFVYYQWNNISAVIDGIRYSNEDIIKKENESKKEIEKYLEEEGQIKVRDLTEEESEAFAKGDLTVEQVIDLITGRVPSAEQPEGQEKPAEDDLSSEIIKEQIAQLYVQKNIYLGKIASIEGQAMAEYERMKNAGEKISKAEFIGKYISIVSGLESACDSTVYGIINTIRAELQKSGKDTSIADKIKDAYHAEKRAKKSYYINKYMG